MRKAEITVHLFQETRHIIILCPIVLQKICINMSFVFAVEVLRRIR